MTICNCKHNSDSYCKNNYYGAISLLEFDVKNTIYLEIYGLEVVEIFLFWKGRPFSEEVKVDLVSHPDCKDFSISLV